MPIDPKEALQYLGINAEEVENLDAFKAHVTTAYVPRDKAHLDKEITSKVFGSVNGALRTKLKNVGKELEVADVKWDEVDPADGIELIAAKAKARTAELSALLEESKKGVKPAKEVEEWQRKYDEAKKLSDELKGQLTTWEQKYTGLEQSVAKREKEARINAQWERAIGSLKFNDGITPLAVKGFHAAVREKFAVEFDDEGNPYAVDAATKSRVPNPNKAHDFLGLDDLVKSYAEAEKLIGGNPNAGKPVRSTATMFGGGQQQSQQQGQQQQGAQQGARRVMPALRQ